MGDGKNMTLVTRNIDEVIDLGDRLIVFSTTPGKSKRLWK